MRRRGARRLPVRRRRDHRRVTRRPPRAPLPPPDRAAARGSGGHRRRLPRSTDGRYDFVYPWPVTGAAVARRARSPGSCSSTAPTIDTAGASPSVDGAGRPARAVAAHRDRRRTARRRLRRPRSDRAGRARRPAHLRHRRTRHSTCSPTLVGRWTSMNAADALARLAAFGLPGAASEPDRPSTRSRHSCALAEQRRALSWVSQAVDAGMVANATPEFDQQLRSRHLGAVQTTMAAHAAAVRVRRPTRRPSGIDDVRVLKGCATGHLDYDRADRPVLHRRRPAHPGLRPRPARPRLRARRDPRTPPPALAGALRQVDHRRRRPTVSRSTCTSRSARATSASPSRSMSCDAHPATFTIGDTEMLALDGPNRLIHAANHVGGSSHYNLNSARDVLQLALVSDVDWQRGGRTGGALEGRRAVRPSGSRRAWSRRSPSEPHPLVEWAGATIPPGANDSPCAWSATRPRGHLLTAPLALPLQRWPGYIGPMLLPSRAYLARRHGKTWSRADEVRARGTQDSLNDIRARDVSAVHWEPRARAVVADLVGDHVRTVDQCRSRSPELAPGTGRPLPRPDRGREEPR